MPCLTLGGFLAFVSSVSPSRSRLACSCVGGVRVHVFGCRAGVGVKIMVKVTAKVRPGPPHGLSQDPLGDGHDEPGPVSEALCSRGYGYVRRGLVDPHLQICVQDEPGPEIGPD